MASESNLKTGEAQVLQKLHSIGKSSQIVSGQFVNVLMSDSLKRGTTLTALNATFSLWLLPAFERETICCTSIFAGTREMWNNVSTGQEVAISQHILPQILSQTLT